jgi:predicted dehydrogenase
VADRIGVAIVGAGVVSQSIHLPVLARLCDDFAVAAIWDVDPVASALLAERCGAASSPSFEDLLNDPRVDVLAICSPARFHADQVVRGMLAGKRAILCEKPLATTVEEARRIGEVAKATGVPLLVGAMHVFDPAWIALRDQVDLLAAGAISIRSSIVLPPNDRFEQWASELDDRAAGPGLSLQPETIKSAVLQVAIHDLPLVRAFLPKDRQIKVTAATLHEPFGYSISVACGECVLDLSAHFYGGWQPRWELEVASTAAAVHIEFPPSFVHAGSSVATSWSGGRAKVLGPFEANGYEGEWNAIRTLLRGENANIPPVEDLVGDFQLAWDIAEQSFAILAKEYEQ